MVAAGFGIVRGSDREAQISRDDVFGQPAVEGGEDGIADSSPLCQNVGTPYPQNGEALRTHESVATAIVVAIGMLAAVDLDNEFS